MTSLTFVSLSGAITFGIPIAIAVRELLTIHTASRDGDAPPPEEPSVPTPRPLPACLLPENLSTNGTIRIRVREDA